MTGVDMFVIQVERAWMQTASPRDFQITVQSALPPGTEVLKADWWYGTDESTVDWLAVVAVTR